MMSQDNLIHVHFDTISLKDSHLKTKLNNYKVHSSLVPQLKTYESIFLKLLPLIKELIQSQKF